MIKAIIFALLLVALVSAGRYGGKGHPKFKQSKGYGAKPSWGSKLKNKWAAGKQKWGQKKQQFGKYKNKFQSFKNKFRQQKQKWGGQQQGGYQPQQEQNWGGQQQQGFGGPEQFDQAAQPYQDQQQGPQDGGYGAQPAYGNEAGSEQY